MKQVGLMDRIAEALGLDIGTAKVKWDTYEEKYLEKGWGGNPLQ